MGKRLRPRVFAVVWLALMLTATVGVIATCVLYATKPTAARGVSALVVTVVVGLPTALEWRRAEQVLSDL